jgi:hypothetical protein
MAALATLATLLQPRDKIRAQSVVAVPLAIVRLEAHKQTPHFMASFERRKDKGWSTEITTWKRVADATP